MQHGAAAGDMADHDTDAGPAQRATDIPGARELITSSIFGEAARLGRIEFAGGND
jgi:hypothetical protein